MPSAIRVPYVDLARQHRVLKEELLAAVERVLESGQFILGEAVTQFEQRFAELCGVKHAIGVNSGTDALILGLRAMGVGPGHEVITAPNSFVATSSSIVMAGARPVFVDVGDDYNIDPALVERAITARTRAIMPVHLTGRPADMDALGAIAKRHGLGIIEDAAQAVAAEYRGRRVGSLGTVGCFSLHPLKTLNACGDGGVVTTNDEAIAEQVRLYRNIGLKTRDDCVTWAGNSRLDNLQAAILLVKLNYLSAWTDKRRAHAAFYRKALAGISQVSTPGERAHERAVYHMFVIQAERRDELKRYLLEHGIETAIHYPVPIHLHKAATAMELATGSFPVAERQAGRLLSLPVYPELTAEQLGLVAGTIGQFYG